MCRKTPPKHDATTPMLHSWDGVPGIYLTSKDKQQDGTGILYLGPASKSPFTVGCYILAASCVLQSLIIFHLLAPR